MSIIDGEEIEVLETDNKDQLSVCSLVLSAMEIPHSISTRNSMGVILVAANDAERATFHLSAYLAENRDWPPRPLPADEITSGIQPPTIIIIGALMLFYSVTGQWDSHSIWFSSGAGNSSAILQGGEYFRLVTALTLHADLTHLLGNCFIGGFLLHFFCRLVGSGMGLAATLTAAVMGNGINVCLHGDGHLFVGYSTAVFATIGMLVMASYQSKKTLSRFDLVLPFMAGVALLAMLGSSGERTDLGAHLFGLLSGLVIGRILMTEIFIRLCRSNFIQLVLFIYTGFIVYLSWWTALAKVSW
jgi:rhomboid protease GluP